MYVAVHVLYGVIHDLVSMFPFQPVIGQKEIGVQSATGFAVLSKFSMDSFLLAIFDHNGANFTAPFNDTEDRSLVFPASASDAPFAFRDVHITSLTAKALRPAGVRESGVRYYS